MSVIDCDLAAEALFASDLQPSAHPGSRLVRDTIIAVVFARGERGCAGVLAEEFGEHPTAALERMVWARQASREAFAGDLVSA